MDRELYSRVSPLLDELRPLGPAERAERLAAVRASDPAAADEAESLLRQVDTSPGCPFQGAVTEAWGCVADDLPAAVGPYPVRGKLGEGGMGVVYRVRDERLRRTLAVKLMAEGHARDADLKRRFLAEAQLMGQLQHPGIPPVHDIGEMDDGRPYFTMKLVRGQTLAEVLAAGRDEQRLLGVFEQVCQTVAFAHRRRVVHLDLKPSNVMVGAFGEVQVMDWGLAKVLGGSAKGAAEGDRGSVIRTARTEAADWTRPGDLRGTPAYMAPEQARGEAVDERADVFGLGAVLCEILTGRPAFVKVGSEPVEVLAARGEVGGAFAALEASGSGLVGLCKQCLAAAREGRPGTAAAVADEVAAYRAEVEDRARRAELKRVEEVARAEEQTKTAEANREAAEAKRTAAEAGEGRAKAEAEAQRRVATEERRRRRLTAALAAVAVLVMGAAGTGVWLARDFADREERSVSGQLAEAKTLYERARAAGGPDRLFEPLRKADAVVERARGAWVSEALRLQAEQHATKVSEEHSQLELAARVERERVIREGEQKRRDDELSRRLLEVELRHEPEYTSPDMPASAKRPSRTLDDEYGDAFRAWGLDIGTAPDNEVSQKIRASRDPLRHDIVVALEEWASERRRQKMPQESWGRLVRLAEDIVPPDGQTQFLQLSLRAEGPRGEDIATLVASGFVPGGLLWAGTTSGPSRSLLRCLAVAPEMARARPLQIRRLASAMVRMEDQAWAEILLRSACVAHPRDEGLHQSMGNLLTDRSPPRWAEAVVYYRVARALRPGLGSKLSTALLWSGEVLEGLGIARSLAEQAPENTSLALLAADAHYDIAEAIRWPDGFTAQRFAKPIRAGAATQQAYYAEALRWFRKGAARGDAWVQNRLGWMLSTGLGGRADNAEAAEWYRKAASQGDTNAQSNLARMYRNGRGVRRDYLEALKWDRAAAEHGSADSMFGLGLMYEQGNGVTQDEMKAAEWYQRAVSGFTPSDEANYRLGGLYYFGRGVPQDYGKAATCCHNALFGVYGGDAAHMLGVIYLCGHGVEQNDAQAAHWFEWGDRFGSLEASYELAKLDERTKRTPQGNEKAAALYRKAANRGYAPAQWAFGWMLEHGKGVSQDEAEAIHWYGEAADQGDNEGQYYLGRMHFSGRGTPQDDMKAAEWFARAAEQGHSGAQTYLGLLHDTGRGVPPNHEVTATWYAEAAHQGNTNAQNNLGRMYEDGRGLPKDDMKAAEWFARAADQGNMLAVYNLVRLCEAGRGVPRDLERLAKLYDLIASENDPVGHRGVVRVLSAQSRLDDAMKTWAKNPTTVPDGFTLALAHISRGEAAEASKVLTALSKRLPDGHPLGPSVAEERKTCERMLALDQRLRDAQAGKAIIDDPAEQIDIARHCSNYKRLHATAARYFGSAFAAKPEWANDLDAGVRHAAARSATLAAAGQGEDAAKLPPKERAFLRNQARGWLNDDFLAYFRLANGDEAEGREKARRALLDWQSDPDLASVRAPDALAKLPEAERAAWNKLWAEVAKLLADAP